MFGGSQDWCKKGRSYCGSVSWIRSFEMTTYPLDRILKAACIPWIVGGLEIAGKPRGTLLPDPEADASPLLVVASGEEAIVERVENGEAEDDDESIGNMLV